MIIVIRSCSQSVEFVLSMGWLREESISVWKGDSVKCIRVTVGDGNQGTLLDELIRMALMMF